MIYDAFISYRHAPLDMEMAKKIHRSLESYHIPGAVQKKTGKKKISRVFRDQEELPIGSDLNDKISYALMESEYLIVICSPQTPGSYWVCKEIETFIQLHDRNHILAVLIDGEPVDSFPYQLTHDEYGNPVEPLAADIRGENASERNKKFKTEILRLAAPLIGCSYDDLRQRHRERVIRKTILYVSTAMLLIAGAGIAFGIYQSVVAKRMEDLAEERTELAEKMTELAAEKTQLAADIMEEYRDKQINQSRFYASESLSLLDQGDRRAAALIAAEGLPSEKNDRPYVPEAEYALSQAMYAYSRGSELGYDCLLNHDLNVSSCHLDQNGDRLVSIDNGGNVYVWDCSDWSLIEKIAPLTPNGSIVCSAYTDKEYLYIADTNQFRKYDFNGNLEYSLPYVDLYEAIVLEDQGIAYISVSDHIEQIDLSDGKVLHRYENTFGISYGNKLLYNEEYGYLACSHMDADEGNTAISIIDPESEEVTDVVLSSTHLFRFCFCENGNIAVVSGDKDFLINLKLDGLCLDVIRPSGEVSWSKDIDFVIYSYEDLLINVREHSYLQDGAEKSTIVVTIKDMAFSYNGTDGSMILKTNLAANATKLLLNDDNARGFVVFTNGDITLMDFESGRNYPDNSMHYDMYMWDLVSANDFVVIQNRFDDNLHILSYHKASDLEELSEYDINMMIKAVSPARDYYIMNNGDEYVFYDEEGQELYSFELKKDYLVDYNFDGSDFLAFSNKALYIINPMEKSIDSIEYLSMGIDYGVTDVSHSNNGKYALMWMGSNLYFMDCQERTIKMSYTAQENIRCAVPSDDGKYIYISEGGKQLYSIDTSTQKTKSISSKELTPIENSAYDDFLRISPNGEMLAMLCGDYELRIIDLESESVISSFPVKFRASTYLRFSEDSKYFYTQTDTYVFRIWDIFNKDFVCCFETENAIFKYEMYDDVTHRLALGNGFNLYLIDTENNGVTTIIPNGLAYLENNSFIIYSNRKLYRTYYKDYKKLLDEIRVQFSNVELSPEEKVKYNIS